MAYDYSSDIAFALDMVSQFGRLVDFHKLSETPADPDKPLEGVASGGYSVAAAWADYDLSIATTANFAGNNNRIVLDKSLFSSGSKLRLSFDGAVDGSLGTDASGITVVVGLAAPTGNPWDFAAAPIPVTFAGQATFDMVGVAVDTTQPNRYVSDDIDLVLDGTSDVVVSFFVASGTTGSSTGTVAIPPDTWHQYLNAAGGTTEELTPAGLLDTRALLGDNQQWGLSEIEVFQAGTVDVVGVPACFVEPTGLRQLGVNTKQNGLWKDSTQIALVVADGVNNLGDFDSITDSDGSTWAIDYTSLFQPGDTPILFLIGVKR